MQLALEKHPDLPNVPLIIDLAKTDEQKQILKLIFARQVDGPAVPGAPRRPAGPRRGAAQGLHGHDEGQGVPGRSRKGEAGDHPGVRRAVEKLVGEIYADAAEVANKAAIRSSREKCNRDKSSMDAKTKNYTGWQSDVIVDMIKRYGFPFITLNPGASFRGLHDSLVNYGDNEPPMMLCNHEEIAVQIAHGYAKATGKPMAVILHNLVGLLHACMAIYYAYLDRVPIFIMGATGPMDEAKRRPHIDWTHTALVQGNAVRDYTKWDYQPTSIDGVPESFARAYSIMMTEPKGPIYMCYDAALQEAPKTDDGAAAARDRRRHAVADGARSAARSRRSPTSCSRPSIRCCCRNMPAAREGGFENIVELAETDRRRGVGRQQRAQLPEQASALPEHGQGVAQAHRPGPRPRPQGLGEAAHRAQQRQAHQRIRCRRRTATMSRSASPRSASANGRWTIAACSRARCARSATPRSAFRS